MDQDQNLPAYPSPVPENTAQSTVPNEQMVPEDVTRLARDVVGGIGATLSPAEEAVPPSTSAATPKGKEGIDKRTISFEKFVALRTVSRENFDNLIFALRDQVDAKAYSGVHKFYATLPAKIQRVVATTLRDNFKKNATLDQCLKVISSVEKAIRKFLRNIEEVPARALPDLNNIFSLTYPTWEQEVRAFFQPQEGATTLSRVEPVIPDETCLTLAPETLGRPVSIPQEQAGRILAEAKALCPPCNQEMISELPKADLDKIQNIVKEFTQKRAALVEKFCETDPITHWSSIQEFFTALQKLRDECLQPLEFYFSEEGIDVRHANYRREEVYFMRIVRDRYNLPDVPPQKTSFSSDELRELMQREWEYVAKDTASRKAGKYTDEGAIAYPTSLSFPENVSDVSTLDELGKDVARWIKTYQGPSNDIFTRAWKAFRRHVIIELGLEEKADQPVIGSHEKTTEDVTGSISKADLIKLITREFTTAVPPTIADPIVSSAIQIIGACEDGPITAFNYHQLAPLSASCVERNTRIRSLDADREVKNLLQWKDSPTSLDDTKPSEREIEVSVATEKCWQKIFAVLQKRLRIPVMDRTVLEMLTLRLKDRQMNGNQATKITCKTDELVAWSQSNFNAIQAFSALFVEALPSQIDSLQARQLIDSLIQALSTQLYIFRSIESKFTSDFTSALQRVVPKLIALLGECFPSEEEKTPDVQYGLEGVQIQSRQDLLQAGKRLLLFLQNLDPQRYTTLFSHIDAQMIESTSRETFTSPADLSAPLHLFTGALIAHQMGEQGYVGESTILCPRTPHYVGCKKMLQTAASPLGIDEIALTPPYLASRVTRSENVMSLSDVATLVSTLMNKCIDDVSKDASPGDKPKMKEEFEFHCKAVHRAAVICIHDWLSEGIASREELSLLMSFLSQCMMQSYSCFGIEQKLPDGFRTFSQNFLNVPDPTKAKGQTPIFPSLRPPKDSEQYKRFKKYMSAFVIHLTYFQSEVLECIQGKTPAEISVAAKPKEDPTKWYEDTTFTPEISDECTLALASSTVLTGDFLREKISKIYNDFDNAQALTPFLVRAKKVIKDLTKDGPITTLEMYKKLIAGLGSAVSLVSPANVQGTTEEVGTAAALYVRLWTKVNMLFNEIQKTLVPPETDPLHVELSKIFADAEGANKACEALADVAHYECAAHVQDFLEAKILASPDAVDNREVAQGIDRGLLALRPRIIQKLNQIAGGKIPTRAQFLAALHSELDDPSEETFNILEILAQAIPCIEAMDDPQILASVQSGGGSRAVQTAVEILDSISNDIVDILRNPLAEAAMLAFHQLDPRKLERARVVERLSQGVGNHLDMKAANLVPEGTEGMDIAGIRQFCVNLNQAIISVCSAFSQELSELPGDSLPLPNQVSASLLASIGDADSVSQTLSVGINELAELLQRKDANEYSDLLETPQPSDGPRVIAMGENIIGAQESESVRSDLPTIRDGCEESRFLIEEISRVFSTPEGGITPDNAEIAQILLSDLIERLTPLDGDSLPQLTPFSSIDELLTTLQASIDRVEERRTGGDRGVTKIARITRDALRTLVEILVPSVDSSPES